MFLNRFIAYAMATLWIVTTLIFAGCSLSSSVRMERVNKPLNLILLASKEALPIGKRKVSSNGREFLSEYFVVSQKKFMAAKSFSTRKYVHIRVLGDRRPYDIEIKVIVEKRSGSDGVSAQYEEVGEDERLAQKLAQRIHKKLSRRRGQGNAIDDFRVF